MSLPVRALVPIARVASVPASIAFYETLGFAVRDTFTPPGADEPSWASLQSGGDAWLMLGKASEPRDAEQHTVLFYLYVDDVAAKLAELTAAGVRCGDIDRPFYARDGEFRVIDPDGYTLMITQT